MLWRFWKRQREGPTFQFHRAWKEQLVVSGPGGKFSLMHFDGPNATVYLPSEAGWPTTAPDWAKDLWPTLHLELSNWCKKEDISILVFEPPTAEELFSDALRRYGVTEKD
jgi:hypothetical protein